MNSSDYRQALRYIIRNTTLPARMRTEAQLQLSQMSNYTRPTQIRNRCIMGGRTRGVFRDFKMTRVRRPNTYPRTMWMLTDDSSTSVWRPWLATCPVSRGPAGNAVRTKAQDKHSARVLYKGEANGSYNVAICRGRIEDHLYNRGHDEQQPSSTSESARVNCTSESARMNLHE